MLGAVDRLTNLGYRAAARSRCGSGTVFRRNGMTVAQRILYEDMAYHFAFGSTRRGDAVTLVYMN